MNKLELIEILKNETGLTKSEAEAVVKLFFNEIASTLAKGDRVEIRGLCSFYVKRYKAYTGRNPKLESRPRLNLRSFHFSRLGKNCWNGWIINCAKNRRNPEMKNLKKNLQSVNKDLKALAKKVDRMIITVGKLEKQKTVKVKPVKKVAVKKPAAKKPVKLTAADTVLEVIKRYRKGVDVSTLMEKTGFNRRKIYDNVKVLKKQGKIKSEGRGVYGKA